MIQVLTPISLAQVAKLVDALCSGRSVRKDVLVRIQSWAQQAVKRLSETLMNIVHKGFSFRVPSWAAIP